MDLKAKLKAIHEKCWNLWLASGRDVRSPHIDNSPTLCVTCETEFIRTERAEERKRVADEIELLCEAWKRTGRGSGAALLAFGEIVTWIRAMPDA